MSADLPVIAAAVTGLAVIAVLALLHRTHRATVTGFGWRREIDIETEHWVSRTSLWGPPPGSRNHRTERVAVQRAVHRTEWRQEYVGGRFQSRPVYRTEWVTDYQTQHTYDVPKRRYSHTVRSDGTSRDDVQWPTPDGPAGARRERYWVEFSTEGAQRRTARMSEARWRAVAVDGVFRLRVTWYGAVLRVRAEPTPTGR